MKFREKKTCDTEVVDEKTFVNESFGGRVISGKLWGSACD